MAEMPVFVRIEDYKDVLEVVNMIKNKLEDAKATLAKINELKNQEDSELDMWHSTLNELEHKIDFVDKSMFEPESL